MEPGGPLEARLEDSEPGPEMQRGTATCGNPENGGSAANGSVTGVGSSTAVLTEHTDWMEPAWAVEAVRSITPASTIDKPNAIRIARMVVLP
jgi:hypothetical protein